jgi:hypothetical protein
MKNNSQHDNRDTFRVLVAFFLIIFGIYLAIRSFPVHPEVSNYFFPAILLLAGTYWISAYFIVQENSALLPGLLFFTLAFFIVLSRWALIPALSQSWPLLLAGIGGALWLNALTEKSPSWPLAFLALSGIVLYIAYLPWFSLSSILSYWPLLLIAVGLALLIRKKKIPSEELIENIE